MSLDSINSATRAPLADKLSVFPGAQQVVGVVTFLENIIKTIGNIVRVIFNSIAVVYRENRAISALNKAGKEKEAKEMKEGKNDMWKEISSMSLDELIEARDGCTQALNMSSEEKNKKIEEEVNKTIALLRANGALEQEINSQLEDHIRAGAQNQADDFFSENGQAIAKLFGTMLDKAIALHDLKQSVAGIGIGAIRFTPVAGTIYSAVKWHKSNQAASQA